MIDCECPVQLENNVVDSQGFLKFIFISPFNVELHPIKSFAMGFQIDLPYLFKSEYSLLYCF